MAIVAKTLIVDSTDMAAFGMTWRTRRGWKGTPEAVIVTHKLTGGDKELFQHKRSRKARRVIVTGHILATSISQLNTYIDDINARMTLDEIKLSFSDDETRELTCLVKKLDITPMQPGAVEPSASYRMELLAPDPRKFDTAQQSIALGVDCPLGTARVSPVITLNGASTNPRIGMNDFGGTLISDFTMTGTIAIANTWEIDVANGVVKENAVSAVDKFSGTLPVLDPKNSDFDAGTHPDFTLISGSVASITVVYNKAWK